MASTALSYHQRDLLSPPGQAVASGANQTFRGLRKWRLTFAFVVTALLAIAVAIIVENRTVGDLTEQNLIKITEENTALAAINIQAMVGHANSTRDIASSLGNAPSTLDYLAVPDGLPRNLRALAQESNVFKLSLFDAHGMTVWSSDPNAIGTSKRESPLFQEAMAGRSASGLTTDHEVIGPDGVMHQIDMAQTYLPLREGNQGKIIGVMELQRDVTRDVNLQIGSLQPAILRTRVGTMAGLFVILLGFIMVADMSIYRHNRREMSAAQSQLAERKQAEGALTQHAAAVEAVNRELEAFSYSVSHDLRAPLWSIDSFSRAILEDYGDKLDSQGKDYLNRVREASKRMGLLIDDLLNLSRVTRSDIYLESVDLTSLAQTISMELRANEPERLAKWVVQERLVANGDPHLLRVVLENLLGNAWKFTAKHSSALIEFGATERDGKPLYFVRDDGAGFDPTYAEKLFGPFQRLHSVAEFEGTGIGLATVQRVVHRHGGQVWAEGGVEQGAVFYFTL